MVTELRVHGVAGTRAEDMLDRPLLSQVAGDRDAAFLRPRPEYHVSTGPGGAKLEAYRWGNMTAGAAARALWLLLLPFMLANVAVWLRPPAGRAATALIRALSRLFALSMTALFVVSMVGVSVDLVAWQCAAPGNTCATGRAWLRFLRGAPFTGTGPRLALLSLVPIAAIGVLWFLARRTWSRYESYTGTTEVDGDGLSAPGFWRGRALVGRLRGLHIATAFVTLDACLAGALVVDRHDGAGRTLLAGAVGLLALCAIALCLPGMVDRDRPAAWAARAVRLLRSLAVLLTVVTLVYLALPHPGWRAHGGLPGYGQTLAVVAAVQALLVVVLGVLSVVRHARGQFLAGLAGPVLGSAGAALAVSFAAGLYYRVADYLDRAALPSSSTARTGTLLQPPPLYAWAGLCFVFALVVAAAVVAWSALVTVPRARRRAAAGTDATFPGGRARDPGRAAAIDAAIAGAGMTERAGRVIAGACLPVALVVVGTLPLALLGASPLELAPAGSRGAAALSVLVNAGSYLIGLATLALLALGGLAYRYPGVRRVVGMLWDLGTFWPRAAHPLAPPCYAERAVPELATRATWLACDAGGGGVVLSGHSQGSVLVAAAVAQLSAATRARVALLTYGSPLHRLYCRLFPAYVNAALLERLSDDLTDFFDDSRWINLWRVTDPIGGPIAVPATGEPAVAVDDRLVADPARFDAEPGDTVPPAIEGHSGYQRTPEFALAVTDLVARL